MNDPRKITGYSGEMKQYPLIECGYSTAEEWNALAHDMNASAFTFTHGREPADTNELDEWTRSLKTA